MKLYFRILIGCLVFAGLYYFISCFLLNGHFRITHYYTYQDMEEAKQNNVLINDDLNYQLINFQSKELEEEIRKNIIIWTCKGTYQKSYGVSIHLNHENKNARWIKIDCLIDTELMPDIFFYKRIYYKDNYKGSLTYTSFLVFNRQEPKEIIVDVRQKSECIGSIIFTVE